MITLPAIYDKTVTRNLPVTRRINPAPVRLLHPSLGIVFPFHPAMWNDDMINKELAGAKLLANELIKEKFSIEAGRKMLTRLENIFSRLDINTLRKSVAIILGPGEEKLIHLDFPVKPMVFFGKEIGLLDLISGIENKESFFLLVLEKGSKSLYDYNGHQLKKVCEQMDNGDVANLYKKTYQAIELLNSKNEKPVFITGLPNLIELFCSNPAWSKTMFPFLYGYHSFASETLKAFVTEITTHWSYWQAKFIAAKILLALQTGSLVTNIEAVTIALANKADGLLLIDKCFSKRLKVFSPLLGDGTIQDSFLREVEYFLARGNSILFSETGTLKNTGGVALIRNRRDCERNGGTKAKNESHARLDIN